MCFLTESIVCNFDAREERVRPNSPELGAEAECLVNSTQANDANNIMVSANEAAHNEEQDISGDILKSIEWSSKPWVSTLKKVR